MSTPSFDVFAHPWIPVLNEQRDSGEGAGSSDCGDTTRMYELPHARPTGAAKPRPPGQPEGHPQAQ